MAEKKTETKKKVQHTFVSATDGAAIEKPEQINAKPAAALKGKKGATKYRIGAIALWLVAFVCEVLAILLIVQKLRWQPNLLWIIVFLVVDLACVIAGSLLWKKANRFDPASEKNKLKFWLWNNMGVIVCAFAFIPFVIIALTNKNADKKTKTIAVIVAIIAALIGGLVSYEWDPYSKEDLQENIENYGGESVYWVKGGDVFHLYGDCHYLNRTEEVLVGTVEQAGEAGKTRVCTYCQSKYDKEVAAATEEKDIEDTGADEKSIDGETEETAEYDFGG